MDACKFCGSVESTKAGRHKTPRGIFQIRKCKKCFHVFKGELIEEVTQG